LSFAKSDPQVKTTVTNITLTTINKIVAIKGETERLYIIRSIKERNIYIVI
jgi:hypothetical protein